ncbi:GNAT family N-acetyltransferase [Bacillus mojavensis]|nr:GNAT family N-acetyltransferase [Bacillus mojavensis]MEC1794523.1 GNAT family N-acetyltransferase [Bacillus mojavensis]
MMIHICKANFTHVQGISKVCSDANWATYRDIYPKDYLESIIREFYNPDRILKEVSSSTKGWGGYFVALENDTVIGAGAGGMISDTSGEIYVLYLSPDRRNEGIGSLLLDAITKQQKEFHATEQWISVQKGNQKGIPFYEAKGFTLQYEENTDGYISLRYKRQI